METKIKNFIEEGEKIKTEVITSVNKWGRNGDWVGNKMDEYKISLIKMIVNEINKLPHYYNTDSGMEESLVGEWLKEETIIRQLSNLRDEL